MAGEIFAGLSAIKTAFDLAKGLKDIDDDTRRNAAVIELQKELLAALDAQSTMLERIRELEKDVARFETWNTEKNRYELKPFGMGVAYVLKAEDQGSEPVHQLCPNCCARGQKSLLAQVPSNQARIALGFGTSYRCPICKTEIT
jgi:hypothetical protein